MNAFWKERSSFQIPGTPYTLIGKSIAAVCTSFYIPELRIMFDCGVPHGFTPETVFITHGHLDHIKSVPETIIQQGNANSTVKIKPNIFVPVEADELFKQHIYSIFALSKHNPNHKMGSKYTLFSCTEKTRIDITIKNKPWIVEVFKCYHTTPCRGYGLIEKRPKLKKEFFGLDGKQLGQLKKQGVQITEDVEFPIICFLGDSTTQVFNDTEIFKYPVIMTECTFFEPEMKSVAWKKKHTHWPNLIEIIKAHPKNFFIVYHFSDRYDNTILEEYAINAPVNTLFWIKN